MPAQPVHQDDQRVGPGMRAVASVQAQRSDHLVFEHGRPRLGLGRPPRAKAMAQGRRDGPQMPGEDGGKSMHKSRARLGETQSITRGAFSASGANEQKQTSEAMALTPRVPPA